jgi:hypothetical protein
MAPSFKRQIFPFCLCCPLTTNDNCGGCKRLTVMEASSKILTHSLALVSVEPGDGRFYSVGQRSHSGYGGCDYSV